LEYDLLGNWYEEIPLHAALLFSVISAPVFHVAEEDALIPQCDLYEGANPLRFTDDAYPDDSHGAISHLNSMRVRPDNNIQHNM
jgi:hypothetical protein